MRIVTPVRYGESGNSRIRVGARNCLSCPNLCRGGRLVRPAAQQYRAAAIGTSIKPHEKCAKSFFDASDENPHFWQNRPEVGHPLHCPHMDSLLYGTFSILILRTVSFRGVMT